MIETVSPKLFIGPFFYNKVQRILSTKIFQTQNTQVF